MKATCKACGRVFTFNPKKPLPPTCGKCDGKEHPHRKKTALARLHTFSG